MIKAVVGLGNPGPRYEPTRHNAGFWIIDALAERLGVAWDESPLGALLTAARYDGRALLLAKPQEFMNRSGRAVAGLRSAHSLEIEDILVIHDDIDLDVGRLKLKRGGGAGGHRGLESIAAELGDLSFPRLRIGVGRPPIGVDAVDFVLAPPQGEDRNRLSRATIRAVDAALLWLETGVEAAMNQVNAPVPHLEGTGLGC